jgi:hypothetical protein
MDKDQVAFWQAVATQIKEEMRTLREQGIAPTGREVNDRLSQLVSRMRTQRASPSLPEISPDESETSS